MQSHSNLIPLDNSVGHIVFTVCLDTDTDGVIAVENQMNRRKIPGGQFWSSKLQAEFTNIKWMNNEPVAEKRSSS